MKAISLVLLGTMLAVAPAGAQTPMPAPSGSVTKVDAQALSASIGQQLQACWSMPPGLIGSGIEFTITLDLLGSGALVGKPKITLSEKSAAKAAVFVASIERAVERCAPFTGFAGLGADPYQSFAIAVTFIG